MPEETLRQYPVFDMAVVGKGEQTKVEIAGGIAPDQISGLVWLGPDGKTIHVNPPRTVYPSFDELPAPAWDLYDLGRYNYMVPVEPSRTCPYRCIFCYPATAEKTRYKDPEKIVDEVEQAIDGLDRAEFLSAAPELFPSIGIMASRSVKN